MIYISDHNTPVFTTNNPIIGDSEAEDILIYRGTADGGVGDDDDQINITDINDIDNDLYCHKDERNQSSNPEDDVNVPDSDFDDFDSDDNDEVSDKLPGSQDNEIHEIYYCDKQVAVIGQCRAIYDYTANMYDELSIKYGDIINIHSKQEDEWWLGECEGRIGIFPATYVESL